jgi:hypothetical protein
MKSKCANILCKATTLRIILNIDGVERVRGTETLVDEVLTKIKLTGPFIHRIKLEGSTRLADTVKMGSVGDWNT